MGHRFSNMIEAGMGANQLTKGIWGDTSSCSHQGMDECTMLYKLLAVPCSRDFSTAGQAVEGAVTKARFGQGSST